MKALPNYRPWLVIVACPLASIWAVQTEYTSHGDPTNFEQYNLELINRARADPNAEAARYGISLNEGPPSSTITSTPKVPLALNQNLIASSRGHSQDMNTNNYFSHDTQSPFQTFSARITSFGYSWSTVAENIAWSSSNAGPSKALVDQFHQLLFVDSSIAGRGHRLNIMNESMREIGFGFGWGTSGTYETQDFGRRLAATPRVFLLGVVYNDSNANNFYDPGEGLNTVTLTPNNGTFFANTSAAGGYAFPIDGLTGSLTVTASGGSLGGQIIKTVNLTGNSIKLDFKLSEVNHPPNISTPTANPNPTKLSP